MTQRHISTFELIALLTSLTALSALSVDIMLPAFGNIAQDFALEKSSNTIYLVVLFILGMMFGELVFGTVADAYGRKKTILFGLAIFAVGTFIAIMAQSFEMLLLARIIQGVGVAGSKIGTRALIRDMFEGEAMAKLMSIIFGLMIIVPMAAPFLGQYIVELAQWRAIFMLLFVVNVILVAWLWWRQNETLTPQNRIAISAPILKQNIKLIIKHPKAMAYTFCAGLILGAQIFYIGLAHEYFVELYNVGNQFPLYFATAALGAGLGSFSNAKLVSHFGMHFMISRALTAVCLLSIGFMVVSVYYNGVPPFGVFIGYCSLVFIFIGVVFGNANALAMQSLGRVAGLGSSLIASISSLIGVALSAMFSSFYDDSTLPLALIYILAGGVSLCLVTYAHKSNAAPV